MDSSRYTSYPVIAIAITGFSTTIGQVLIIREFLPLFYGNEISVGLLLACWLFWTAIGSGLAGRTGHHTPVGDSHCKVISFLLLGLAAALPLTIGLIRAARILFAIPPGELAPFGKMVMIAFGVTGTFCVLSGALFSICWSARWHQNIDDKKQQSFAVYLGEALGAAAGGILFYYLLFPYLQTFAISLCIAILSLAASGWILGISGKSAAKRIAYAICFIAVTTAIVGSLLVKDLEKMSRQWQWGRQVVAVKDTPYHNIAISRQIGQLSVFANGLWLFSIPDRLSAEHNVHVPMLEHHNPERVLIIGGGIAGQIEETLKYPNIRQIDYVESDPDLIPALQPHLNSNQAASLQQNRLRIFHGDAAVFIRKSTHQYDVILMNVGDPINAEMNRFFTEEFYKQIEARLLPKGIFSFSVSGSEEILGYAQSRFVGSIQKTLSSVFSDILVIPGDQVRFVASNSQDYLTVDVPTLLIRKNNRRLDLSYIREDTLTDMLNPFRLDYMKSILAEFEAVRPNKDLSPTCYFHNLMLWAFQWDPKFESALSILSSFNRFWFWLAITVAGLLIQVFFWTGRQRFMAAVRGSIAISGAMEMILQLILLLVFQVLEGFMYLQLSLIIAFYMAGLGCGAACISRWANREKQKRQKKIAISNLIRIQAIFSGYPIILAFILALIHGNLRDSLSSAATGWCFSGLSFSGGLLGGMHFALAVLVHNTVGSAPAKTGGTLYGLDLVGAGAGVLVASFFIIPVYGFINALIFLSALSLISLGTLLRQP